ncbi:hypothetical protein MNVI_42520 [Mycobacterium noviomagense]|uniref:Uncharacterized protein n=1 Tax=Mycobacterium noviomagense TaxID=459858 RepID=A0A7I7PK16_9MYCO|nr:hypothetical protein MNVI_42520 [Mycobacterium noviomagense]
MEAQDHASAVGWVSFTLDRASPLEIGCHEAGGRIGHVKLLGKLADGERTPKEQLSGGAQVAGSEAREVVRAAWELNVVSTAGGRETDEKAQ